MKGCGQPFFVKERGNIICGRRYTFGKFFCKQCYILHSFEGRQKQMKKEAEEMKNDRPQMEIIPPNYKELTELILAFVELYKHAENKNIVDLIIMTQLKPLGVIVDNIDLQIKREDV